MKKKFKFDKKNILHYFYIAIAAINLIALYFLYVFISANVLEAFNPHDDAIVPRITKIDAAKFDKVMGELDARAAGTFTSTSTFLNNF